MPTVPDDCPDPLYLGLDVGTSGCRAVIIDRHGDINVRHEQDMPPPHIEGNQISQDPSLWWQCLEAVAKTVLEAVDATRVKALAIDATSSTVLLCHNSGEPAGSALMYNDSRAQEEADRIAQVASPECAAHGPTSALAKALWLKKTRASEAGASQVLQQADWITGHFLGQWDKSDHNNAIKLGYDPVTRRWPAWLTRLGLGHDSLPEVHATGSVLGSVTSDICKETGLLPDTQVVAGTTDGVAAFVAAEAWTPGMAVTSLGSTLVLKLLTEKPVFAPEYGIYSHKIGDYWLVGGASNSGGAVLAHYFSKQELIDLEGALHPEVSTGLVYYPLLRPGERFPIANPDFLPKLEPRPDDKVTFYQALLEGLTGIEAEGYALLARLSGTRLIAVHSTGGGSRNRAWAQMRENKLGVPVGQAKSEMAAYGAALIAAGQITRHFQKN